MVEFLTDEEFLIVEACHGNAPLFMQIGPDLTWRSVAAANARATARVFKAF
jgi:hypothetical protein